MKHQNVVEFLWGSPIITDRSDEDWIIFTSDQQQEVIRHSPNLAGPRGRHIDGVGRPLNSLPNFLYEMLFYHIAILFPKEYYMDESAATEIEKLMTIREDVARMNLSKLYLSFYNYAQQAEKTRLLKEYTPKLTSKLLQSYTLINNFASGCSFEEAYTTGVINATPIKLNLFPKEIIEELLLEQRTQFHSKPVLNFFNKEPDIQTYQKVIDIVSSIDINNLSGIPVKGQYTCPVFKGVAQ